MTISIRLGELCLLKGNYKACEKYFTKIVERLRNERIGVARQNVDAVKLELKLMEKIVFVYMQQEKIDEVLMILDESEKLAKSYFLVDITGEIQDKR